MDKLRSEEEIMGMWTQGSNIPLVSICCITYNHENYIEDALRGFLVQKTNFPFEILIHDDASTDKTRGILKKYYSIYPNIIKLIIRDENQYSVTKFSFLEEIFTQCKGEYLAICEGDDYWTSCDKLQIQVDSMKSYPEVNLSFHPCSKKIDNVIVREKIQYLNKVYSLNEHLLKDFHFIQSNSLMIKKCALQDVNYNILKKSPVGDVFLRIWGSYKTGALCINRDMSVYRVASNGSWTSANIDCINRLNFVIDMCRSCDEIALNLPEEFKKTFFFYKLKLINLLNNCAYSDDPNAKNFISELTKNYNIMVRMKIKIKRLLYSCSHIRILIKFFKKFN
jgi:glycosyltransferase involved in cell wall biosynthesis